VPAEVVQLHDAPSLRDVTAHLRRLADAIDAGDLGAVETVFVLIPQEGSAPIMYGYGGIDNGNEPIIQLNLALQWHLRQAAGLEN